MHHATRFTCSDTYPNTQDSDERQRTPTMDKGVHHIDDYSLHRLMKSSFICRGNDAIQGGNRNRHDSKNRKTWTARMRLDLNQIQKSIFIYGEIPETWRSMYHTRTTHAQNYTCRRDTTSIPVITDHKDTVGQRQYFIAF